MTDRRLLKTNGRVAHASLEGAVEADLFVSGERQRMVVARASLWPTLETNMSRDRELNFGEEFIVLDRQAPVGGGPEFAFGFCTRDDSVGWVHGSALGDPVTPTHKVSVARTYAKMTPDLTKTEDVMPLSYGSPLSVVEEQGNWSRFETEDGFPCWAPSMHLASADTVERDPVTVARMFLGTPYDWGGNSAYGIDCSGLVQAALLACGAPCPPDSDLQALMPGQHLSETDLLKSGDLLFWKGHVAIATGPDMIIHANAHHMIVVEEPAAAAIRRIAATETGPVTSRLRLKF